MSEGNGHIVMTKGSNLKCRCEVALMIWNINSDRYAFRQKWLSQNVPNIFDKVRRYTEEWGEVVYVLKCKECGKEVTVPAE